MSKAKFIEETVVLDKQTTGLGFTIRGGTDEEVEDLRNGIFVTSIKCNGAAARSGRVFIGDKILKIDGHDLTSVTHAEAVNLFHQTGDIATLLLEKRVPDSETCLHGRSLLFRKTYLWLPLTIVIIIFGLPTAYVLYKKLR